MVFIQIVKHCIFSYPYGNCAGPSCFRLGHLGFKETGPTGHQTLELIFSPAHEQFFPIKTALDDFLFDRVYRMCSLSSYPRSFTTSFKQILPDANKNLTFT